MTKKEDYVLFCGRFANQKGLEILLQAAKELPKIKFVLMGSGILEKKLKSIAADNVIFKNLNPSSGKDFYDTYAKALIFCLPSYGEGFPIALIEAMASGCGIISTIPLKYNGKILKTRSVETLKKTIQDMIKNKKITIRQGRSNKVLAKQYTWKRFVDNLDKIYTEIK